MRDKLREVSNYPELPTHATSTPSQKVAEKASSVGMRSALRNFPAMRGGGKAIGGRAKRGGRRGRKRMFNCSVCGKPCTRKDHAPPCDPDMKEKWQGQVDVDGEEEEEEGEEEEGDNDDNGVSTDSSDEESNDEDD